MGLVSNQEGARPENLTTGTLGGKSNSWELDCYSDIMTDKEWCQIVLGVYTIYYGRNYSAFYYDGDFICVPDSDYPGKSAMIRVGKKEPHVSMIDARCFTADVSSKIIDEMLDGSDDIAVRIYVFPYDTPIDVKTTAYGLSEALKLRSWMQDNLRR